MALAFTAASLSARQPDIVIQDVRIQSGGEELAGTNLAVVRKRFTVVSQEPIEPGAETIVIDGGGRLAIGRIEEGALATLLVVDGTPFEDAPFATDTETVRILLTLRMTRLAMVEGEIRKNTLGVVSAPEELAEEATPGASETAAPQLPWTMYNGKKVSALFIGGVVLDFQLYDQNAESLEQVGNLSEFEEGQVRGIRLGVTGTFKVKKPVTYTIAGATRAWDLGFDTDRTEDFTIFDLALGFQTKIGTITLGKQKEPISMERMMGLNQLQLMERPMHLDALLPSRNTGITLANGKPLRRYAWKLGVFNTGLEPGRSLNETSTQFVGRLTGVAYESEDQRHLLHLGLGVRYSNLKPGVARGRSGPETFFAPDFVDTSEFPAEDARYLAFEASWRKSSVWINTEYVSAWIDSAETMDPQFEGFHISGLWAVTGETRIYDHRRGVFTGAIPRRSAKAGGLGLIEIAVRFSGLDLTDGLIEGGEIRRATFGVNYYPIVSSRFQLEYGRIELDRFGFVGQTNVFAFRWMFMVGL
jgi:phosphate-selective porin OprO/OprP